MLNLFTTITNLTAYYPITTARLRGDLLTASVVGFAAVASALSHLFESHKHQMWGFGTSPSLSYCLNWVDVFGVAFTVSRCLYLWYRSGLGLSLFSDHPFLVIGGLLAWVCNNLSERDPGHFYYLPLHCIWHLSVFLLLNAFLTRVL